jgi:hypothetical protein
MQMFRRRPAGTDTNEIAVRAAKHSGSRVAAIASAIAVAFSAFSLWETSLKQADLGVYVTGVATYERDLTADIHILPSGGFEVFAVPITIANSGARDAPILGMELDVKNPKTGLAARFKATYTADGAYFAKTGDKRPKTPFSALVIAGRSAWTGTVLFYPVSYSNGKALTPVIKIRAMNDDLRKRYATEMGGALSISILREKRPDLPEFADLDAFDAKVLKQSDMVEASLKLVRPAPSGWLDRVLATSVEPIALTWTMPDIPERLVERGEAVRLLTAGANS